MKLLASVVCNYGHVMPTHTHQNAMDMDIEHEYAHIKAAIRFVDFASAPFGSSQVLVRLHFRGEKLKSFTLV